MYFDNCKTAEEVEKLAKELKVANHPDKFSDPVEKEIQEEIFKEIEIEKDKKYKELAEKEKLSFEKSLKKPLDWTEIKKNMSPEMKESGKKIVTETINLAGGILSNFINKNIWK